MKKASSYKQMREQLELVLQGLEVAETSDIDKIIILHDKAIGLISKLEDELNKKTATVKKLKV